MYKKSLLAAVLLIGLFFMGCKDEKTDPDPDPIVDPTEQPTVDPSELANYPYSTLTAEQQKVKLENESLVFLEMGNALKKSSAIEAFQTLNDLLEESSVEINAVKKVSNVKEVVECANMYGVYTWNASKHQWDQSKSTTELRFVFPSKMKGKSNNAIFSAQGINSDVEFKDVYEEYDNKEYYDVETTYYLPQSTTGTLTIDGTEAAKVTWAAEYKNKDKVPVKTDYQVTLNDGYVLTGNIAKATENKVSITMTYGGTPMFEAIAKSNIKIDEIIDLAENDENIDGNYSLFAKANAYIKLMDNLVLVYEVNIENFLRESDAIEEEYDTKYEALGDIWDWYWNKDYNYTGPIPGKDYFTKMESYNKAKAEAEVAAFNKNMTVFLASTKDGTKIADLIVRAEEENEHWDGFVWNGKEWNSSYQETLKYHYYQQNAYLKFKDNTEIEASVYFSEGFNGINNKWEEFVDAFDR